MGMLLIVLIVLIVLALLCAPVTLQADVYHADRTLGRIRLTMACFTRTWRMRLVRTPTGHQLVAAGDDGGERAISPDAMQGSPAERLLHALSSSAPARHYLLAHIHLIQLDAALQIHTEDAARTALFAGLLRSATLLVPSGWRRIARIRIQPDFFRDRPVIQARCILQFRLGTIIITAGMLLASIASQRAIKSREAS